MFNFENSGQLLVTALLIALIFFQKRIGILLNLSKVVLRASRWEPAARARLPSCTAHLLACAERALKGFGFEYAGTLAAAPFNRVDPRKRVFAELHWDATTGTLARVELGEPNSGQPTKVTLFSFFDDGRLLMTVNRERWALLPVPEEARVVDDYADDLAAQWQAHLRALAEEEAQRAPLYDRSAALVRHACFDFPQWLARMQRLDWVRDATPGEFRFTARGAWAYATQLTSPPGSARVALVRPFKADPAPDLKALRFAEMDAVAANLALAAEPLPAWIKGGLFVLTLAASAILFGHGFGLTQAAALLLVLLIHELGHLAAMWLFNYRNLSIFFLPLLGAAATGHKPDASPWQEAMVLLAGPLPGLLLALLALQLPAEALPEAAVELVRSLVWFGLVLNLFNLLPFGMLDGGRLFELAVLGRFPRARALFGTLGAVIGLIYAFFSGSLLLGIVMVALLISTPLQFRAAGMVAHIRARARATRRTALTAEQVLRALGRQFARGNFAPGAAGWGQRLAIATLAYPRLLQGVPGLVTSAGVVTLHAAAFALAIGWGFSSWRQPEPTPLMRPTAGELAAEQARRANDPDLQRAREARSAFLARYQAADAEARLVMLEAAEQDGDLFLVEEHEAWLERARGELLAQLPPTHPGRLGLELRALEEAGPEALPQIAAAINRVTQEGARPPSAMNRKELEFLLEAYGRLVYQLPAGQLAQHGPGLEALWEGLGGSGARYSLRSQAALMRARAAADGGDLAAAEPWMERYRADAREESATADLTFAWFLIDAGRHERALDAARQALAKGDDAKGYLRRQWLAVAGWAELGRGRAREADLHFQMALAEQAAEAERLRAETEWWLRWLLPEADAQARPESLDHLLALQAYDPPQAAQLTERLRAMTEPLIGTVAPPAPEFGGWGKGRRRAHERLLAGLGLAQAQP